MDREVQEALRAITPRATSRSNHQGARANWHDPDDIPSGVIVIVRLGSGDIFDGMKADDKKIYVWDAFGNRVRTVRPMGWLPRGQRLKPLPVQEIGIDVVHERVLRALRTLRAWRAKSPEHIRWTYHPDIVREFSDSIGHQSANGEYIGRDSYQRGAPDDDRPREIFTPTPRDIDDMDEPLRWFADLKGPALRVGGVPTGKPTKVGQLTLEQRLVWDRSLAYVPGKNGIAFIPPSWQIIAYRNRISAVGASRNFETAMRKLWFVANKGELR